jgi:hypothetical protein
VPLAEGAVQVTTTLSAVTRVVGAAGVTGVVAHNNESSDEYSLRSKAF